MQEEVQVKGRADLQKAIKLWQKQAKARGGEGGREEGLQQGVQGHTG